MCCSSKCWGWRSAGVHHHFYAKWSSFWPLSMHTSAQNNASVSCSWELASGLGGSTGFSLAPAEWGLSLPLQKSAEDRRLKYPLISNSWWPVLETATLLIEAKTSGSCAPAAAPVHTSSTSRHPEAPRSSQKMWKQSPQTAMQTIVSASDICLHPLFTSLQLGMTKRWSKCSRFHQNRQCWKK